MKLANSQTIAQRIKQIIKSKYEDNQRYFAKASGLDESLISKLVNGRAKFTNDHLIQIEMSTRLRKEWLMNGSGNEFLNPGEEPVYSTMPNDGDLLKEFLKRKGINQKTLATSMGRVPSTIHQYLNSENITSEIKAEIAKALNTSIDEIFTPEDRQYPEGINPIRVIDEDQLVRVLRISVKARAGLNYEVYRDTMRQAHHFVEIPRSWLKTDGKGKILEHAVIEIDGDSMEPRLEPGNEVLAHKINLDQLYRYIGRILAFDFGDYFIVKRFAQYNTMTGECLLSSDNPDGGTLNVNRAEFRHCWFCFKRLPSDLK